MQLLTDLLVVVVAVVGLRQDEKLVLLPIELADSRGVKVPHSLRRKLLRISGQGFVGELEEQILASGLAVQLGGMKGHSLAVRIQGFGA